VKENDAVIVKDGRLAFQSKESLMRIFQKYAEASDEKISDFIQPFHDLGFYSLRPVVTEKNEVSLQKFYKEKFEIYQKNKYSDFKKRNSGSDVDALDYLDDFEDIIGDDTFAAFLNSNAEIQIANEIYKYTDVGLFITNEDKYNILQEYLSSKKISNDLMEPTVEPVKEMMFDSFPNDGLVQINDNLTYFKILPIDDNGGNGGGGGGSVYTPAAGSVVSTDPSYNAFLSNLSSCDPHSGVFGTLFGDNDVCIDKYESRRRVKTKAFNYNYFAVFHLGVKCVNQYRGWTGFWRVEATDEIRLVVESVTFQYDLDALVGNNAINSQTRERAYFMNNQKAFFAGPNTINFNNEWGQPFVSYVNLTSLPKIFHDDLTFEFFGTGNDYINGLVQRGIDSNLTASKFNEWFYNGLYSIISSQMKSGFGNSVVPPDNRTFVSKFPQTGKMIIQKSVNDKGFNIGDRQKTFDWGAQICFGGGDNGSGWRIRPDTGCNIIVRPNNFRVKMIGAVRKGNSWHGSKFNDGID
jgi:hypothetical protein